MSVVEEAVEDGVAEGGIADDIVPPPPPKRGEYTLVQDLERFCADNRDRLESTDLQLMRNMSCRRGVSFFETSNFHPDFVLWTAGEGRQRIAFIDPKGLRQEAPYGPKVRFHQKIKGIERRLGDPTATLDFFIVSVTTYAEIRNLWGDTKVGLSKRNTFFQALRCSGWMRGGRVAGPAAVAVGCPRGSVTRPVVSGAGRGRLGDSERPGGTAAWRSGDCSSGRWDSSGRGG